MRELYLDVETTSGDPKLDSLNPWSDHCKVLGFSFAFDDEPVKYVAVRHHGESARYNMAESAAKQFCQDLFNQADVYINHNIKYDLNVFANWGITIPADLELIDTVCSAKLIDSDRWTHNLKQLSIDWLGVSAWTDEIKKYTHTPSGSWCCKDFGVIPAEIMSKYANFDVDNNRNLHRYIEKTLPAECGDIYDIEKNVTRVLFDIERRGMTSNAHLITGYRIKVMQRLVELQAELRILIGHEFRPDNNTDMQEVICERLGFPVVEWTDKGAPSFNKHAMATYLSRVDLTPFQKQVIALCNEYRNLWQLNNLFLVPYSKYNRSGILHPSYNQLVRTGRMSCREPNMQQLSNDAKALILPATEGDYLVSADMSQVEFRLIAHYTRSDRALTEYANDKNTDFHQMIADWCEIPRKPAKNINFASAYGAGKKKIQQMLDGQDTEKTGIEIYNRYHRELPELKRISKQVETVCKSKGYVRTLLKRRRNLQARFAYRAFNTVIQGSAADLMRAQLVELHKRGFEICAVVHDEVVCYAKKGQEVEVERGLKECMEDVANNLGCRVPFTADTAKSNVNWKQMKD